MNYLNLYTNINTCSWSPDCVLDKDGCHADIQATLQCFERLLKLDVSTVCGNEQQQHHIVRTTKVQYCMVVAFLSLSATAESYWGKTGGI